MVVVDTETTGLPAQQPAGAVRIMQLGYVVCDFDGPGRPVRTLGVYDRLVRLDEGTFVDPASHRIHGLDAAVCNETGADLADALAGLMEWLTPAADGPPEVVLVGHHVDFDLGILAQEARRLDRPDWLRTLGMVSTCCTMEWGRDVCRLALPWPAHAGPGRAPARFKNPKLVELYAFLFGDRLPLPPGLRLHSAIVDARVCAACYVALHELTSASPPSLAGVSTETARGLLGVR